MASDTCRWQTVQRHPHGRTAMPQQAPASPTVLRIILGRQLQTLREKAGLSYEQAAEAIYASEWTLRRMEKAEVGFKLNYVKSLLMAYGRSEEHTSELQSQSNLVCR